MRSGTKDVLPSKLRRALLKCGEDISVARRRRRITKRMMAERLGVALTTYDRIERGDPGVAMGTYMMALLVLGLGIPLSELIDPRRDDTGMLLEAERLPKRIRAEREPQPT